MSIERYKGQPLPIIARFQDNPLTVYNKDYVDVIDVSMNLKVDLKNDSDDLYIQQRKSEGTVVIDEVNHRFIMQMDGAYTNLEAGQEYYLTVNVKVNGFTDMLELKFLNFEQRKVKITHDTNRE